MIVFILSTSMLYSCSDSNSTDNSINPDSADNSPDSVDLQEETAKDIGYEYGGPKLDFKGEAFVILYPEWSLYLEYYFAEEEIGDAMNDALYKRIVNAEEFFNIKIQTRAVATVDHIEPEISKEVLSGTNSIDIALTHCISGHSSIVSKNYAYNWHNMPNVDFTKKYWNQSAIDELSINGYMPFPVNDFIIPDPCFITFSKDLVREYGLESPYELVKSGKWTWDKLSEMAKQVSRDLDGDGQFTDADLYGFVGELDWQFINLMYACDQRLMKKDTDGRYVLDVNTPKTKSIVEKLYDLLYVGNQSFPYQFEAFNKNLPYVPFDSGRALFYMNQPSFVKVLRATEFDFGILPYPKYNEQQKNYVTLNWAGTICAPLNISNPEKVGAVAEYLGAISHEIVKPVYYDILLNGKVTRDEESKEMLDIIYGDSIYDFGLNFSSSDLLYIVPWLLKDKSTDVTSYYERRANAVQLQYDKIYDAFIENSKEW